MKSLLVLVALGALTACAASEPKEPTLPNRMADGSRCVSLKVNLTCVDATVEGQCTVTVHNISGETATVHSAFAVGDRFEASKWRNLFFKVADIKGFIYRMNARYPPSAELGESLLELQPTEGKKASYDVAILHHRVSGAGTAIPLPFGDYKITAHYDVSQINQSPEMPFCEQVFASNAVRVEILGPSNNLSPIQRPNRVERSPRGTNPINDTIFVPQGGGGPF